MITTFLVIIAILLVVILIISIRILIKKTKTGDIEKKDLEILKKDLELYDSDVKNELQKSITENLIENKKNFYNLQDEVKKFIDEKSRDSNQIYSQNSKELRDLLTDVSVKTESIKDVKEKVGKLDNLLSQNNKAGKAGEYLLERIMQNIFGFLKDKKMFYETQYIMKKKNGEKKLQPDLFIFGDGAKFVNIPVDSKFSFNAYLKILECEPDTDSYNSALTSFNSDIKNRINETAKYISEEDNTVYSIMFVPSEGVFSFLNANSNKSLIDYAFKNKVIIAGPSTLVAIIESIDKYMSLFENINIYDKKIKALDDVLNKLDNYDNSLDKLFDGIENLTKLANDVHTKTNTLKKTYKKLLQENDNLE